MSFLETLFGVTSTDTSLTLGEMLGCLLAALILGLLIGIVYYIISGKQHRSLSFFITVIILPAVVSVVISLVGSNIASAFSIAGVFTLVRFRSAPGESKDITLVFLAMASGLACAFGYITLAFVVLVILSAVIVLISMFGKKLFKDGEKQLRIVVPEDMNYQGAFDDLFHSYTDSADMVRVKTTNMGTLYELTYHVVMKPDLSEKEFLDAIRCRNGNLTISLCRKEAPSGQL